MMRRKYIGIVLGIVFAALALWLLLKPSSNQSISDKRSIELNIPHTRKSSGEVNPVVEIASNQNRQRLISSDAAVVSEQKVQRVTELTKEEQVELEGNTRNEYGIRQDILQFIEENVPKDNPKAFEAAIKLAQYQNKIYYHARNQNEALILVRKNSLASRCLMEAFPSSPMQFVNGLRVKWGWEKIYEGITNRMNNTAARDKRMWNVDDAYFSWQLVGTGLTSAEEKARCAAGDF